MAVNYIPDSNRFRLPEPPAWFLQGLYEFDPRLVIVPSRIKVKKEQPAYLLCMRRQYSAGLGDVAMLDNKHPDTNMCYAHGLLPIAPLRFKKGVKTFTQGGLNSLIADLKSRNTWALSGGPTGDTDKIWKDVEYAEEQAEQKRKTGLRDMFYHMARDAYRSLKARTGQRNRRASDYHGIARPQRNKLPASPMPKPPSGQRVILTDAL